MALEQLLQYFFAGITEGAIYAIIAIGFNIIYNTTGIINFAQGEFLVLGGMIATSQEDFDAFVNIMKSASDKKIWVHCAIGMRASAFLYKYRCSILGENRQTAIWDLREIWEPFGAWKKSLFCDAT